MNNIGAMGIVLFFTICCSYGPNQLWVPYRGKGSVKSIGGQGERLGKKAISTDVTALHFLKGKMAAELVISFACGYSKYLLELKKSVRLLTSCFKKSLREYYQCFSELESYGMTLFGNS